jgi:hypothetical protein
MLHIPQAQDMGNGVLDGTGGAGEQADLVFFSDLGGILQKKC